MVVTTARVLTMGMLGGRFWSRPHLTNGLPSMSVFKELEAAGWKQTTYLAGPGKDDWSILMERLDGGAR